MQVGAVKNSLGNQIYFDNEDLRGRRLNDAQGNLNPGSLQLWNTAMALRQWEAIVDVGCNYGEMLVSSLLPENAKIWAFEPNPQILPFLKRTLSEFPRDVALVEKAISDVVKDELSFIIDESWSGKSGVALDNIDRSKSSPVSSNVVVPGTTLDHELIAQNLSSICIKVDVEGHEMAVLKGADGLLKATKEWAVVLEILHMPDETIANLAAQFPLFLIDLRTSSLVPLEAGSASRIRAQLNQPHFYAQDALLLSSPELLVPPHSEASDYERSDRPSFHEVTDTPQDAMGDSDAHLGVNEGKEQQRFNNTKRRAVYTALIGQYEKLNEQPEARRSACDFICFTDDPELTSETWTIRVITPRFPTDSIRSARFLKIMGPELLRDYDESLWIDNTVQITTTAETILDQWLATWDLAIPLHSFRQSVAAEFDAVDAAGYDDPTKIYEQLISYSSTTPTVLTELPYWTALIARRHNKQVLSVMRVWYEQVLRYSRRDQLSINYALFVTAMKVAAIPINNHMSDIHRWPVSIARNTSMTRSKLSDSLRIPYAALGRLQNQMDRLKKDEAVLREEHKALGKEREVLREQHVAKEKECNVLRERHLAKEKECNVLREQHVAKDIAAKELKLVYEQARANLQQKESELSQLAQQLNAIFTSRSWRVTEPLRRLKLAISTRLKG